MRLTDLEPRWIERDGRRIGFAFRSPTDRRCWQTCFASSPSVGEQIDLFDEIFGEHTMVQPCNPEHHWEIAGGIAGASFETMSVSPSLDGSAGGLWHGNITNGEIVGGLPS